MNSSGSTTPVADFDSIYKLPSRWRYFNISVLWIFYYPLVIRAFYALRIRHEVATGLSLLCGLTAAVVIAWAARPIDWVVAAILVHLKDVFDATDGALARLTRTGHRLGRFIDTLGDGVVFSSWIVAVGWRFVAEGGSVVLSLMAGVATWLSLFLQCSYFNYHQLHYQKIAGVASSSRLDERDVEQSVPVGAIAQVTRVLQKVYELWFGWQDRLLARCDRRLRASVGLPAEPLDPHNDPWFGHRGFMIANSALCFGTHAFILICCLLVGQPIWFFPAIAVGMNLYFGGIVLGRRIVFRRRG